MDVAAFLAFLPCTFDGRGLAILRQGISTAAPVSSLPPALAGLALLLGLVKK